MASSIIPAVDFSPLANLGKAWNEGKNQQYQDKIRENREMSLAALGQGASVEDVSRSLFQAGDIEGGLSLARLADARATRQQAQSNADRSFGLQEREFQANQNKPRIVGSAETGYYLVDNNGRPVGGQPGVGAPSAPPVPGAPTVAPGASQPAGPQPIIPAKPKAAKDMPAGDRKAIWNSEDENADLDGTVAALSQAKGLNEQAFTGYLAGSRGNIGSKLPGAGMVPGGIFDPAGSKATLEWQKLMSPEALKQMANTLKGATTDFELRTFIDQLADPSTPTDVRGRIIDRMQKLAERKREINQTRMNQLREGTYYKPGGGQSAPEGSGSTSARESAGAKMPQIGEVRDGYRYKGGNPGSPESWSKVQ